MRVSALIIVVLLAMSECGFGPVDPVYDLRVLNRSDEAYVVRFRSSNGQPDGDVLVQAGAGSFVRSGPGVWQGEAVVFDFDCGMVGTYAISEHGPQMVVIEPNGQVRLSADYVPAESFRHRPPGSPLPCEMPESP